MSEDVASFMMDVQEKRRFDDIFKKIPSLNVKVDQLSTGDFLLAGERGTVLIERKSIGDLAGSVGSGQLFKELKQMFSETREVPGCENLKRFLLVEGSPITLMRRKTGWQFSSLMSAMVCVPIAWNVNLIWLEERDLTVSFIYQIAKYLGKPVETPGIYGSRPKRREKDLAEQQRFLIEGLTGVGGKTADKWLSHTKSPWALLNTILGDGTLPGLGEKRRNDIKRLLVMPYEGST